MLLRVFLKLPPPLRLNGLLKDESLPRLRNIWGYKKPPISKHTSFKHANLRLWMYFTGGHKMEDIKEWNSGFTYITERDHCRTTWVCSWVKTLLCSEHYWPRRPRSALSEVYDEQQWHAETPRRSPLPASLAALLEDLLSQPTIWMASELSVSWGKHGTSNALHESFIPGPYTAPSVFVHPLSDSSVPLVSCPSAAWPWQ